ncbi:MAG: hypothetical protein LBH41_01840 [Rickettsiales bacterium]|nr:hypothetical protein [Rickettsiales bacterium]
MPRDGVGQDMPAFQGLQIGRGGVDIREIAGDRDIALDCKVASDLRDAFSHNNWATLFDLDIAEDFVFYNGVVDFYDPCDKCDSNITHEYNNGCGYGPGACFFESCRKFYKFMEMLNRAPLR